MFFSLWMYTCVCSFCAGWPVYLCVIWLKNVGHINYPYHSKLSKNHYLMAAILDLEAILNLLPMLLKHFPTKLLFLTYNVNLYHFHAVKNFILSCPMYIVYFNGHLGFWRLSWIFKKWIPGWNELKYYFLPPCQVSCFSHFTDFLD
jgi:hypothetical protein